MGGWGGRGRRSSRYGPRSCRFVAVLGLHDVELLLDVCDHAVAGVAVRASGGRPLVRAPPRRCRLEVGLVAGGGASVARGDEDLDSADHLVVVGGSCRQAELGVPREPFRLPGLLGIELARPCCLC